MSKNASEKDASDKIWEEIKDIKMDLFALPNQTVSQYFKPVSVEPSKLYLNLAVTSALPALETAIGDKFVVEQNSKFIVVSYKAQ